MRIFGWLLYGDCSTQLHRRVVQSLRGWSRNMCCFFFDFRKAFDSVPHAPLMAKVWSLGLDVNITRWINNYLANRIQAVVVNGSESSVVPVRSGVPQGSVLGPLLFLIYIDDLPGCITNPGSKTNLFADDVLLYHKISQAADYATLQMTVSSIEAWSVANSLSFNTSKCKYMVISRKLTPSLLEMKLQLNGEPLQRVESYKYLGLILSNNLSWSAHISSVCSKARQILGLYSIEDSTTVLVLILSNNCICHW